MNELPHAFRAIYNQLSEDTALTALVGSRIFYGSAKEGAEYPCVVFQHISGLDSVTQGGQIRFATRPIFLIKAIGKGDSPLLPARVANAVDKAIETIDRQETIDGDTVTVQGCVRQEPFSLPDRNRDSGIMYQHVGAYYQFWVTPEE